MNIRAFIQALSSLISLVVPALLLSSLAHSSDTAASCVDKGYFFLKLFLFPLLFTY